MNHLGSISLHPLSQVITTVWEKRIRGTIHLHPSVEAFCDGQGKSLCNASTEALRGCSHEPGGTVTGLLLGTGRCATLPLVSLGVGNDDFATTKETRVQRKCTRTKQHKRNTDDDKV